jgi:hypothetical protein
MGPRLPLGYKKIEENNKSWITMLKMLMFFALNLKPILATLVKTTNHGLFCFTPPHSQFFKKPTFLPHFFRVKHQF